MRSRGFVLAAVAVCLLLAGVVSGFASAHPDGLERVAEVHDLGPGGASLVAGSPLADYPNGWAGIVGCALAFALLWTVTRVTARFTRR